MSYVYPSEWELNLKGDAFNAMKDDFDKVMKRTLSNMEKKGSEDAEITVKLKINLTKNESGIENGEKKYTTIPNFGHKVSSVMQIKDEFSGSLGGNYELVWCDDRQEWIMREIRDGQSSFFDAEYDIVDIEPESLERKLLVDADMTGRTNQEESDAWEKYKAPTVCVESFPSCICLSCANNSADCCTEHQAVCGNHANCEDYERMEDGKW